MINELPSIFEVVTGAAKKQVKEKSSVSNHSSSKSKSNSKSVKNLNPTVFWVASLLYCMDTLTLSSWVCGFYYCDFS